MVHGTRRVDLGLVGAGDKGLLDAGEDVEVVVGGVAAGVAFCAYGGAEDDEVFGDAFLLSVTGLKPASEGEEDGTLGSTYWHG